MIHIYKYIILITLILPLGIYTGCQENDPPEPDDDKDKLHYNNSSGIVAPMADPFILKYNDKYYLYGTDDIAPEIDKGFKVYVSENMIDWGVPQGVGEGGRALEAGDSWGSWGFWGAEVYERDGTFYMFYTVEEHLAIASSASPLGPFKQDALKPMRYVKEIDGHLFEDDNGRAYLYYVSFENNSNEIYVEEMNDDWLSTKPETKTRCIWWTQIWENNDPNYSNWPVAEGSAMLKHNGIYYLFYTANHFLSPNYAVGYATATSPLGPWTKYVDNPILTQTPNLKGTGHCAFVLAPNQELYMVFHAHKNINTVLPRKMCFDRCEFLANPDTTKPDIPKVYQTDTWEEVFW